MRLWGLRNQNEVPVRYWGQSERQGGLTDGWERGQGGKGIMLHARSSRNYSTPTHSKREVCLPPPRTYRWKYADLTHLKREVRRDANEVEPGEQ